MDLCLYYYQWYCFLASGKWLNWTISSRQTTRSVCRLSETSENKGWVCLQVPIICAESTRAITLWAIAIFVWKMEGEKMNFAEKGVHWRLGRWWRTGNMQISLPIVVLTFSIHWALAGVLPFFFLNSIRDEDVKIIIGATGDDWPKGPHESAVSVNRRCNCSFWNVCARQRKWRHRWKKKILGFNG